jgi:ParB family chromosome partitioning protein
MVPIDRVQRNPDQPRRSIDPTALEELADSIRIHGILQPLLVRETQTGYELIAGERRLRAARLAGLTEVPVVVRESVIEAAGDRLELALVENLQRKDIDPIDQATALRRLVNEFGLTQEAIAERLGWDRTAVAHSLRLLNLAPQVQEAIRGGFISAAHGRILCGLDSHSLQVLGLQRIAEEGWSTRQTEAWVRHQQTGGVRPGPRSSRTTPASRPKALADADTMVLEEELRRALNTKVILTRLRKGGRITIEFYSDEEFAALHSLLTSRT